MVDDALSRTRIWSAARVIGDVRDHAPGHVAVCDGRIVGVGDGYGGDAERTFPRDTIAPGFIDLQVNGCAGVDFLDADPDRFAAAARYLATTGTTAFLPTLISAPVGRVEAALRTIDAARRAEDGRGARVVGVHLEGPVLNPARAGAHDVRSLRAAGDSEVAALLEAAADALAMMTLAPELPGARALIRALRARGVAVALGHSEAQYDETRAAIEEGVRVITHGFNAVRGIHHREPGPMAAAALDERCACGLIADGIHVHPAVVALCFRWFGARRLFLVTDAIAAAGMPPGAYALAGRTVHAAVGDAPRLADGALAGSALRMDAAVANAASWGVGLRDAVIAATAAPAAVLGDGERGRLANGLRADLCILDESGRCRCTILGGEVAWRAS